MGSQNKILCPIDFSKGSDCAVAQAAELAKALGAEIELLHAYQLPVLALPDAPITASPAYVAELTNRAQAALDRYRDELVEKGLRVSTRLAEGTPSEAIVAHANESGARMIVLGTHGRSGLQHFLLGSTAERVVRTATVPVLTVRLPH